ncbi:MFS transporter [Pyruvatibacter mobilis]|uniref:MFS transporter n=1 Tax=Pyruvatibacter mobilis TaxID=1712261 RepID=UPI003C79EB59
METQGTERSFAWYLGGLGTWFGSLGLQMVLFPFLAAIVLEESAFRVGLAQTALMAPSILFMIFGGAFAERRDTRSLLIRIHMLASVPPFLMAAILVAGELSFGWIILYGLAMGTMSAFAIPARDSLLSHVAEKSFGPDIQRAVVLASGIQFVGQLAGIILAGTENLVGAPALLIFQALVMLGGAVMVRKLAAAPPMERPPAHPLEDMRDGIRTVFASPILMPVVLGMFAVGVLYVGAFMVLLPLMVRDYYGGDAGGISLVNICFWGGTIVSTFTLLRLGHIHRRGLVLTCSLSSGAVVLFLIGIPAPFWVMCLLCFCWGLGAGTSMTMSRTIVQLAAPPSHRARVLSIFQLGFAGGGPIGAFITGFIIAATDVHVAAWIPSATMVGVLLVLTTLTRLVSITSDDIAAPAT